MRASATQEDKDSLVNLQTKLDFAGAGVDQAEAFVSRVHENRTTLENSLIREWSDFDPTDDDALCSRSQRQIELSILATWLLNPPPLARAALNLQHELGEAKAVIQNMAQAQHPAEHVISCCHWFSRLVGGVETQPLGNKIHVLRQITVEVMADIRTLLEARRGIPLTPDMCRTGLFQRGKFMGTRNLTSAEIQSGFADE